MKLLISLVVIAALVPVFLAAASREAFHAAASVPAGLVLVVLALVVLLAVLYAARMRK